MKNAFLVVAALLGAGCVGSPASVLSDVADPIAGDATAALGGQFHIGLGATEPTIGVGPDGDVYMTAMKPRPGFGRMPTIVRSLDGGQTWEDVGPMTHLNTNDPLVLVDPDTGRIYTSDILPLSCTFLSWSDDQGATWTTNPYACGNSQVNDHQTIAVAKPRLVTTVGYPNVVYICTNDVAYFACATSLNGGLTFGPQIPVDVGIETARVDPAFNTIPVCGATTGHLKAGPDGKVYLPKSSCSVQPSPPVVYVTDNDGLTWTKKTISSMIMEGHEIGFAVDEENNLYAFWPGADGRQYFAASNDGGDTWSEPLDVTAPGVTATMFTAAIAMGAGKVAFAYVGSTIEGGYDEKGTGNAGLAGDILGQPDLPEWDEATWNGYLGVITDVFAAAKRGADATAVASGGERIVTTTTVNPEADPLARGLCGRTRCHGMNDFIDMAVGPDGRPWVAFVDVCTKECVDDPEVFSDGAVGVAGTLLRGPSLLTGQETLIDLAPPPAPAAP